MHHYIPIDRFFRRLAARKLPRGHVDHTAPVPSSASLQAYCPPAFNQADEGSCTANAIVHTILICSGECLNGGTPSFKPSRQFVYACELELENPDEQTGPLQDLGANAADGYSLLATIGVCSESLMPYVIDSNGHANFGPKPTPDAYADAKLHLYPGFTDVTYSGPYLSTLQQCISNNKPVDIACLLFPSFENIGADGIMPMPSASELQGQPLGGHETVAVGYDSNHILVLNSWSPGWGKSGFYLMPIAYLTLTWQQQPVVSQLLTLGAIRQTPTPPPATTYSLAQAKLDLARIQALVNALQTNLNTLS
jgi:hypothetical protein